MVPGAPPLPSTTSTPPPPLVPTASAGDVDPLKNAALIWYETRMRQLPSAGLYQTCAEEMKRAALNDESKPARVMLDAVKIRVEEEDLERRALIERTVERIADMRSSQQVFTRTVEPMADSDIEGHKRCLEAYFCGDLESAVVFVLGDADGDVRLVGDEAGSSSDGKRPPDDDDEMRFSFLASKVGEVIDTLRTNYPSKSKIAHALYMLEHGSEPSRQQLAAFTVNLRKRLRH